MLFAVVVVVVVRETVVLYFFVSLHDRCTDTQFLKESKEKRTGGFPRP